MRTYRKYQVAALLAVFAAAFVVVSRVPAQKSATSASAACRNPQLPIPRSSMISFTPVAS